MGFMNDMRKLLFGAKSVGKSAARKAGEAGREVGEDLRERSETLYNQAKGKAGELRDKAEESSEELGAKAEEVIDKAKDKWTELEEELQQRRREHQHLMEETPGTDTGDTAAPAEKRKELTAEELEARRRREEAYREFREAADRVGNKFLDLSDQAGQKFMAISERVGEELFQQGGKAFDKAKVLGRQWLEKANELAEKSQEADKSELEEMLRQAHDMGEKLERQVQETRDRFAGRETGDSDSLLDDKDDFFTRAERFAKGDYHNQGQRQRHGELEISKDPDYEAPKSEGTVAGFEDLDGDGDEIIDDAILDLDDEQPKKDDDQ